MKNIIRTTVGMKRIQSYTNPNESAPSLKRSGWHNDPRWGRVKRAKMCPSCREAHMITFEERLFLPEITKCPKCGYSED
jgi:hypothetical protein